MSPGSPPAKTTHYAEEDMFTIAIILVVAGWIAHHWVKRRQFYRRDPLGNDVHRSYTGMLGARFVESTVGFIGGTASVCGWLILFFMLLSFLGFFG